MMPPAQTWRLVLPSDTVSVGVLVVTSYGALGIDGILTALGQIGAPSWQPVDEVVASSVERLLDRGLVELLTSSDGQELCFAATPAARARLPDLLEALPLSRSAPDIGYKLKMMSLDLLDGTARERQLAGLVEHWRDLLALWKEAEAHCPCVQPMVRHWMRRNALLARSEIEWLTSVGDVRAASRAAV